MASTLPEVLDADDIRQLYEDIVEHCERLEFEWRPLFEDAFRKSASYLPPSQNGGDRSRVESRLSKSRSELDVGFLEGLGTTREIACRFGSDAEPGSDRDEGETDLLPAEKSDRLARGALRSNADRFAGFTESDADRLDDRLERSKDEPTLTPWGEPNCGVWRRGSDNGGSDTSATLCFRRGRRVVQLIDIEPRTDRVEARRLALACHGPAPVAGLIPGPDLQLPHSL